MFFCRLGLNILLCYEVVLGGFIQQLQVYFNMTMKNEDSYFISNKRLKISKQFSFVVIDIYEPIEGKKILR